MRHIIKHILAAFVLIFGPEATFGQSLSPLAT
ncbi:secreted protein, partial [gut metagenome]